MRYFAWSVVLLLCLNVGGRLGAAETVVAGPGKVVDAGWGTGHWQSYDVTDGLGYGQVHGIVQDDHGVIWFATVGGLSCYDGQQFIKLSSDDRPTGYPRVLYKAPDGTLWFGTSGGVYHCDLSVDNNGETWKRQRAPEGIKFDDIWSIYQTVEGTLWFGTRRNGLVGYDGKDWVVFGLEDGLPDLFVRAITQDAQGTLWVTTSKGVAYYKDNRWVTLTTEDGLSGNYVRHILSAAGNHVWFGTHTGLSRYDGQIWTTYTIRDGLGSSSIGPMLQDQTGHIWCSTYINGVSRYDGLTWRVYNSEDGLAQNLVSSVYQDREGHYWFGTPEGVSRYDEHFTTFTTKDGLPHDVISAMVKGRNGDIWFGTQEGASRYDGKTFTTFTDADGLGASSVTKDKKLESIGRKSVVSIFEDRDDNMWFGVGGLGISRYDGKTFTIYTEADGLVYESIETISQGEDGHLWFGGEYSSGISRFDPSEKSDRAWTMYEKNRDGIVSTTVKDILHDRQGICWTATPRGLQRFDGKDWRVLKKKDGLPQTNVRKVYQDREGNLWVGTRGAGVGRYDGVQWETFDISDGLASNVISAIFQDNKGHMWFGTEGGGVSRFDGETFQTLTRRDGLGSNTVKEILQDKEGRIWFATGNGATVYGQPSVFPPKVSIQSVVADQNYKADGDVTLPSTANVITISFRGMSFKTRPGGMVYRYRLKGYDDAWRFTRDVQVVYENLPIGSFVFEVQAVDRDLVYSEHPATLAFIVQLPYERIGLWGALGIALVLVIGQTVRVVRRDRKLKAAQAQLIDEMEKELKAARDMQMGLMPDEPPVLDGIELAGICIPAREVGGDYYTFLEDLGESKIGFVVADVSGKGMQAATIVMRFNEMLVYEASANRPVQDVLKGLDVSLRKRTPPEMFATCGIGVLDLKEKTLAFDSAACPEVYHFRGETEDVDTLEATGLPLGLALEIPGDLFGHVDVSLKQGDILVFTSDGVDEAQTLDAELYGGERLAALLERCGKEDLSASAIRDAIVKDVMAFSGDAPQTDDLTVLVLKMV